MHVRGLWISSTKSSQAVISSTKISQRVTGRGSVVWQCAPLYCTLRQKRWLQSLPAERLMCPVPELRTKKRASVHVSAMWCSKLPAFLVAAQRLKKKSGVAAAGCHHWPLFPGTFPSQAITYTQIELLADCSISISLFLVLVEFHAQTTWRGGCCC
jgi:hypothetical protein